MATNGKTLILGSWILFTFFIVVSWWNMDAGMIVGFLAGILRWEEIREIDKALKSSKDKFWIGFGIYWLVIAMVFAFFKLTGALPESKREYEVLLFIMFLPILPRWIRYDYRKYRGDSENKIRW